MIYQHPALPRQFDSAQTVFVLPADGHVRRRICPKQFNERIRRCKSAGGPAAINSITLAPGFNNAEDYSHNSYFASKQPSISALQFSKNIISKIPGYSKLNGCSKRINGCSSDVGGAGYFAHPTSMNLPKYLYLTLRYLQEVIRAGKVTQYSGSSTALLDSLLQSISSDLKGSNTGFNKLEDSINTLFNWLDEQIYENFSCTLVNKVADQSTETTQIGLKNLANLEKCILKIFSVKEASNFHDDTSLPTNGHASSSENSDLVSRLTEIPLKERNKAITSNVNILPQIKTYFCDESINQLIEQLRLRKIERFDPKLPELAKPEEDDSEDSDSGVQIDEEREEREEQTLANICEERIKKEGNREIHTKKTRTVNTSQTKKCLTIRTHRNIKLTEEDFGSFRENSKFDASQIFATKFPQTSAKSVRDPADELELHKVQPQNDMLSNKNDTSVNNGDSSETNSIKVSSTTSQYVAKKIKHNGRLFLENEAHKVDLADLNLKETQVYQGATLVDCKGEGAYEEKSIVGSGRPDRQFTKENKNETEQEGKMYPLKTHVLESTKTSGDENLEGKQNFFQASTLASYITLNDNLRFYEEQQRKRISYTYGSNTGTPPTHDYVDLKQLLQSWDSLSEHISIPTKYLDETEEVTELEKVFLPTSALASSSKSKSLLESLEIVTDFLVLRAKDQFSKPTEVRGGPKTALIVYATQTCSLLYQEAFLVTYRSFVSSIELINKLITRYLYMNSVARREQKTASQEQKAARQTFSLLVRVVHELCTIELTKELVTTVTSFVYKLIRAGNYDFARILRRRLIERIEEKSMSTRPYSSFYSDALSEAAKQVPSIFEFRSSVLAKQITALDAELFNKIEPAEMLWWAEDQNELKSPNVVTFTEHFNKVSYWIRTQVISQPSQRTREKYLLKFIKIMKQLRKMGNYNSYLAILSALDSGPLRRLDWTKNLKDQLAEHAEVMESSHSFRNYRKLLSETAPPCLPYVGLILQDLTFVHVGNPDRSFSNTESEKKSENEKGKDLINYGKRWQQFAILDNIRRFKTWPYDIQRDDKILRVFDNFTNYLPEEETWTRSFEIKPRAVRQTRMN